MLVSRKSLRRRRSGAAALETAVVAPVFLMLVFGQIEAARLGMVSQMLTAAAREGARAAVINGNTNSDVTTRVNGILSNAGLSSAKMTQSPSDCTTVHMSSSPNTITVSLSVDFSSICWPSPSTYFKGTSVTASATMVSERP
jgi:Flp pilus assembly protein TadG